MIYALEGGKVVAMMAYCAAQQYWEVRDMDGASIGSEWNCPNPHFSRVQCQEWLSNRFPDATIVKQINVHK